MTAPAGPTRSTRTTGPSGRDCTTPGTLQIGVTGATTRSRLGFRSSRPATACFSRLLILGPLLGPGYLLLRDAVSTPRSYLTDSALGLTDAAARAVPQDASLATLSVVVDGGLVVKAILLSRCGSRAGVRPGWSTALLDGGLGPQPWSPRR